MFKSNFQESSSNSFKKIWYLFRNFDFWAKVERVLVAPDIRDLQIFVKNGETIVKGLNPGVISKVGWVWSVPMNVVLNRETIVINFQTAGLFRVVLLVFWKPFSRFEIRISLPRSSLPADVLWSENSFTTRSNLFFKIAWHLHCEQTSNPQGRFHDNFSGHPLTTDSVSHAGKELKTLPRFMFYVPKVYDVLLQTQGSLWNLLRFLSKHFMFFK